MVLLRGGWRAGRRGVFLDFMWVADAAPLNQVTAKQQHWGSFCLAFVSSLLFRSNTSNSQFICFFSNRLSTFLHKPPTCHPLPATLLTSPPLPSFSTIPSLPPPAFLCTSCFPSVFSFPSPPTHQYQEVPAGGWQRSHSLSSPRLGFLSFFHFGLK